MTCPPQTAASDSDAPKPAARPVKCDLYMLPVRTRVPLKFGSETLERVTCARVAMTVADASGRRFTGWGETPLSVQWVWPSAAPYHDRHEAMGRFCEQLTRAWAEFDQAGHALEVGCALIHEALPGLLERFNADTPTEPMPYLAALLCCSAFDIALHDAYGHLVDRPIYQTYNARFMSRDLSHYLTAAPGSGVSFAGKYPEDFFAHPAPSRLVAWHLVGGLDPLGRDDLRGDEPDDGYPLLLEDWIRRDGITCLKIKLRGRDEPWDVDRLVRVGRIALEQGCLWLTADFNCTVTDPAYVNRVLDRLRDRHPRLYAMLLYVEQPFPYDLKANRIDVRSVAARKPLFMDESAHDWEHVKLGRSLGWTGVALKTCKTQSGALLSLCWARAHAMTLMVQDLTNPMLAMIPHAQLAAHAGTIMGVEANAMQFYPRASEPEQQIHPGLYQRRRGELDLSTLQGPGFGYRVGEIPRDVGRPAATAGG